MVPHIRREIAEGAPGPTNVDQLHREVRIILQLVGRSSADTAVGKAPGRLAG